MRRQVHARTRKHKPESEKRFEAKTERARKSS